MSKRTWLLVLVVLLAVGLFLVQSSLVSAVTMPGPGPWMMGGPAMAKLHAQMMSDPAVGQVMGRMMADPALREQMIKRMTEMRKFSPEEMAEFCGGQEPQS